MPRPIAPSSPLPKNPSVPICVPRISWSSPTLQGVKDRLEYALRLEPSPSVTGKWGRENPRASFCHHHLHPSNGASCG